MKYKRNKTTDDFKKEVFEKFGEKYIVLGDYINNKVKIKMFCNRCQKEFLSIPHDLLMNKGGCPWCKGQKFDKDEILKKIHERNYEIKSDITLMKKYYPFKHNICGFEFNMELSKFILGRGCPKCGGTKLKTNEEFLEGIKDLDFSEEYIFLETYVNDRTKIKVKHILCGNEYKVSPSCFIQGSRCPICSIKTSHGSKKINQKLNSLFLPEDIITEKSYENLKHKNKLRFDYFIKSQNTIIEFDGRQHFEIYSKFYNNEDGIENLKLTHAHDEIKNNFCKENSINLFRISYKNQSFINTILNGLFNEKRSETIEKFEIYSIINGIEFNKEKYYDEYIKNLVEYTKVSGSEENE